ncbi:flagellar basal body rod protein FlgB [Gottfriedia solisilvae]|uniref:Flagellar basal body rod protein FlgB n=1 Tax=Gottfriedia solisilvae TaxID=1516104 RepID=A0A8J3EZB0_9BACI|nr:flagellar basal body rod protein FlgB [Gottfriedia solisilvae]GGI14236.1 flagellar basal body rod protein FlgB [Gottfriedia solisilvae]
MKLFSSTITALERGLDYSVQKQKAISQNIANADTPNYKAKDVSFKTVLENEMNANFRAIKTNSKHFDFKYGQASGNSIVEKSDTSYLHNGNNVDLDTEMAQLAENQIYNQALVDRINGQFNTLKSVIRGGK